MAAGLACLVLQLDTLVARERPPRIQYTTTKLPNGLWLVLHEDHSTRSCTSSCIPRRLEERAAGPHRFAHLFEHLMFQGSRNVAQDQHQSFIASVGGESNATTNEDATVYWETIPGAYLPLALWLEADRMATLKVDEAPSSASAASSRKSAGRRSRARRTAGSPRSSTTRRSPSIPTSTR